MSPRSVKKGIILVFTLLLALTAAQIESSQLGVRFNKRFADKTGKFVLGSAATVAGLAEWEDSEIVHLAHQAHQAAAEAWAKDEKLINAINSKKLEAKGFHPDDIRPVIRPTVTTVLVIDNTAYISTSMRGGSFLYRPKAGKTPKGEPRHVAVLKNNIKCRKEVVDALARCQAKAKRDYGQISGHRTGASCGEPMSMLAFCATTTQKDIKTSGARIVSVHDDDNAKGTSVVPPCGEWDSKRKDYRSEWGCGALMDEDAGLNIRVIRDKTSKAREGKHAVASVANNYP